MIDDWGSGRKLHIDFNQYNQPIGPGSVKLATQMGMMAKDGNRLPVTFKDWRAVDESLKEKCWAEIKVQYTLVVN